MSTKSVITSENEILGNAVPDDSFAHDSLDVKRKSLYSLLIVSDFIALVYRDNVTCVGTVNSESHISGYKKCRKKK